MIIHKTKINPTYPLTINKKLTSILNGSSSATKIAATVRHKVRILYGLDFSLKNLTAVVHSNGQAEDKIAKKITMANTTAIYGKMSSAKIRLGTWLSATS